jgi:hypothetical protein
LLRQEMEEDPDDPWVLYLYAWTANRLEMPESALGPALDAWNLEPSNQWYLAECLKAMRETGMLQEMMELSRYVRGGGVCRYYLADAEIRLGMESSPSLAYLLEAIASRDDSTAADACAWLCILLGDDVDDDSTVSLATKAVELAPGEEFYRCLLAEKLA